MRGIFFIPYGKMLLSHIMGMNHTMSISTLALLLLAEVLVAIILIGISIEICSYGWKKSNGIKYFCLLISLLLGTASILGLLVAPAYFFLQLIEKGL
ncbi:MULTISPECIES: DUF4022 family protein [Bacillus cereus group]|uniref:DUF4022 domain-containing protein n=1 Tax=Bacillus cereus HuA2-1 TaxID=1053201 RepID=J9CUC3_BACCE|nr:MULTISPECIES: DUF4022 family protein [Bacillus cereus group]EJV89710.1 hypothetical protein IG3_00156 [Bacillus cereus HuA2-1]